MNSIGKFGACQSWQRGRCQASCSGRQPCCTTSVRPRITCAVEYDLNGPSLSLLYLNRAQTSTMVALCSLGGVQRIILRFSKEKLRWRTQAQSSLDVHIFVHLFADRFSQVLPSTLLQNTRLNLKPSRPCLLQAERPMETAPHDGHISKSP